MTEEEIEYFRLHLGRLLNKIFMDKPITKPTAYFAIWHDARKVLEEELSLIVNTDIRTELDKIQKSN